MAGTIHFASGPFRKEYDMTTTVADGMKTSERTPLLLRRMEDKPETSSHPLASHMTVVTTSGMQPEMHDQQEDADR